MRACIRYLFAAATATLAFAGTAFAAPCAGFNDVDALDPYCADIAWMKNRGITQGCAPGLYCPLDVVVRTHLAAFLHRFAASSAAMHWVDGSDTFVGRAGPGFSLELLGVAGQRVLLPMEPSEPRGYRLRYADAKFEYEGGNCTGRRYFKAQGGNLGAATLAVVTPAPANVNYAYVSSVLDAQPYIASEGDMSTGVLACTNLAAPGFAGARYQAMGPYALPTIAFPLFLR